MGAGLDLDLEELTGLITNRSGKQYAATADVFTGGLADVAASDWANGNFGLSGQALEASPFHTASIPFQPIPRKDAIA
jgi:hypothetical protein